MAIKAIAFTMYPVTDMKRAAAFYRDDLGLPAGEISIEYWMEFELEGGTFGIGNFAQVGKAGTAQALALEVADLDAFRAKLVAAGHTVSEPHDLGMCRISDVKDPDGNTVWLHEAKPR